jgi:hypothetical protein
MQINRYVFTKQNKKKRNWNYTKSWKYLCCLLEYDLRDNGDSTLTWDH